MTVGEKIRKFRIDQGYTQKELAIMSGLSESAIRNYELGNRFPSSKQLEKIAKHGQRTQEKLRFHAYE